MTGTARRTGGVRRRRLLWLPIVVLGGCAAVLIVEARIAVSRNYLPEDPAFAIDFVAEPRHGAASGTTVEIAVLGDSLVSGLGVDNERDSLPGQIALQTADALGRRVHVTGFGVSGAVTEDVRTFQAGQLERLRPRPDVVVVEVGSNDVTHRTAPWKMEQRTRQMLRRVREAAGGAPVILGSAGKLDTPNFLQPLRITIVQAARLYRRAQRHAARKEHVRFMDVPHDVSPAFATTPGANSSDAFHPAAPGYEVWARPLAADVVDIVRQSDGAGGANA